MSRKTVRFEFGALREDVNRKHTRMGELIAASNVRRTQTGHYVKRPGYGRTAPTFTGASWTGPAECLLPGENSTLLTRDAADRAWVYDPDATTYRDRGRLLRVMPRTTEAISMLANAAFPVSVEVGNNTWVFGAFDIQTYLTVFDTTTGVTILAQTIQAVADSSIQRSAVYDGTNVWLFLVADSAQNVVRAYRYDPASPGAAPTLFTYQTLAAAATVQQIATRRLSSISETAVVVTSMVGGGDAVTSHSYLDPATGAPRAAPAAVVTTTANAGEVRVNTGLSILVHDGSLNTWWYARWRFTGGGAATATLWLSAVNATTLAVVDIALGTSADTVNTLGFGVTCGYLASNGNCIVYGQYDNGAAAVTRPDEYDVVRYTYDGASTTTATVAKGSWIASQPVTYGGAWYFLTGYDDVMHTGSAFAAGGFQRVFQLRDSDGNIYASIDWGNGPAAYHRASYTLVGMTDTGQRIPHVPALIASGTKLIAAIGKRSSSVNYIAVAKLEIEMAETFGKPVRCGTYAVAPGAITIAWSRQASLHEAGPMLFPSYIRRTAGAGTDANVMAAVYRITEPNGDVWESSPVVVTADSGAGDTVEVPQLRHVLPGPPGTTGVPTARVDIAIYVGDEVPYFQGALPNYSNLNSNTFTLPTPLRTDEALYTTGGALSNMPTPPAKWVNVWRNRLFLGSGSGARYSQEIEEGFAPRINEVLRVEWTDGSGDSLAGCPVDWNYFAIFKRNAICVISGPGPDGRGTGNYVPQTLTTKRGCTNLGSIVSGPGGCYFQDSVTKRICVITPSLEVREIATHEVSLWYRDGAALDGKILSAAHDESQQLIVFATETRLLVVDYRHPTEAQPFGQIYQWVSAALGANTIPIYAQCVDSTGHVAIESGGVLRRPGSTYQDSNSGGLVSYEQSITTGDLAPEDFLGEFDVSWLTFLGTFWAAHTFQISVFPAYATSGAGKTLAMTGSAADSMIIGHRPASCARIAAVRVTIQEQTGTSTGQGFEFHALAMEYHPRGRARHPESAKVI